LSIEILLWQNIFFFDIDKTMKKQRLEIEYLSELGLRIKLIRTYMKYDQKMLAEYLKTSPSQVSKFESGKSAPTLYYLLMIKKLAHQDEYLRERLSWSWLLEGIGKGVVG